MAGFSVSNQVFAAVNQVTSGLLTSPVSGLLGLAWQTIAASGAVPFWETLASGGAWTDPVMSFQLTRCVALFVTDVWCAALWLTGGLALGKVHQ